MLLESLTLTNFRQYSGTQTVKFATAPEKNVTLIYGVNGAGKTGLFLALNWCLYGSVTPDGHTEVEVPGVIISKAALQGLPDGARATAAVEVAFRHDVRRFRLRRALEYWKRNGTPETDKNRETVTLHELTSGEAKKVENPSRAISTMLPPQARRYFFFDGEKIDEFARPGQEAEIREAVWQVLGLNIMDSAAEHTEKAAKNFQRELKDNAPELKQLLQRLDEETQALDEDRKNHAESVNERRNAEREIDEIDEKMKRFSQVRELIEKRAEIGEQQRGIKLTDERLVARMRDDVGRGAVVAAQRAIAAALAILDEVRVKGEIPSNIRERFIRDLLERHRCICGREIVDDASEHRALMDMLRNAYPSDLEDEVLTARAEFQPLPTRAIDILRRLVDDQRERAENRASLDRLHAQLEEVDERIGSTSESDIKELEASRRRIVDKREALLVKAARLDDQIRERTARIEGLRKEVSAAKVADRRNELTRRRTGLAWRAKEAIEKLRTQLTDEKRQQIEQVCADLFRNMVWKNSQFQNVALSPDYSLEVFDRFNMKARPDLSAGERQVLSLAFITAMAKACGNEAPFVIDTPFARLSREPRANIARHLPRETRQFVLFVTDVELTREAEAAFEERAGRTYTLCFDDTTGTTTISDGRKVESQP